MGTEGLHSLFPTTDVQPGLGREAAFLPETRHFASVTTCLTAKFWEIKETSSIQLRRDTESPEGTWLSCPPKLLVSHPEQDGLEASLYNTQSGV